MKVSLSWLKELVEYKLTPQKLAEQLSLMSIGVKTQTNDYLELDLTYNRGDLLSLRGVAREIAAVTGSKLLFSPYPSLKYPLPKTPVEIEDPELSAVQCVAKIEGLKVGSSSSDWIKKLADSDMRSVNNIADVTNLVMLEYGQPLHSFDAQSVKDETINVRLAKAGEEITTLDGKLRKLTSDDTVLADTDKPLDVAGVMGGKNTEIKDSTNAILLSASLFNPLMVRRTSKRLGLYSEASKRFQHGLNKTNLLQALNAAIKMYEALGGKLTAINLVGDLEDKPKRVNLTQDKIDSLLGIKIEPNLVEEYLQKLGFTLASQGPTLRAWEVTVPYWRLDINIEEDLIEEIARIYGYDKIDGQPLKKVTTQKIAQSFYNFIYDLKVSLKKTGLTEVQTYSFYSTAAINALGWDDVKQKFLVKIANPISAETEYLRQAIWPNLLEVVGKNLRKGFMDIAVFEVGKAFNKINGNPTEDYRLAIALCNGTDNPTEELISIANVILGSEATFSSHERSEATPESKKDAGQASMTVSSPPEVVKDLFHPKRFVAFEKDGKQVGGLAEVHLRVLNTLGIEKRVAVLEIELESHGYPD